MQLSGDTYNMWCGLVGDTATDILVHFPAYFPVGSPLVSVVCPRGRRACVAPYHKQRPRRAVGTLGRPRSTRSGKIP